MLFPGSRRGNQIPCDGCYRGFLKGVASEQNIRMLCGGYRGICEGYEKAFAAGSLDTVILQQRSKTEGTSMVSYLGILRTAEYGSRIRMTAYHAMPEKGIIEIYQNLMFFIRKLKKTDFPERTEEFYGIIGQKISKLIKRRIL